MHDKQQCQYNLKRITNNKSHSHHDSLTSSNYKADQSLVFQNHSTNFYTDTPNNQEAVIQILFLRTNYEYSLFMKYGNSLHDSHRVLVPHPQHHFHDFGSLLPYGAAYGQFHCLFSLLQ